MKATISILKLSVLIISSIVSTQIKSIAVLETTSAQGLVDFVAQHPNEHELKITFSPEIPSDQRTEILNDAFAQLAQRNLTHQIQVLHLSGNKLTTPPVLTGLSDLQALVLDNNQLTTSPVLTGLSVLKMLFLQNNQLTIPPVLTGLSSLQALNLNNNQLTTPPVLTGLSSLQALDLFENQLTTPPVLTGLSSLQALGLSENRLTTPPVLIGLSDLQVLNLSNNQLTSPLYIPANLREKLKVYGYENVVYVEEPLLLLVTEEQLAQILPLIIKLENEAQAKIIARAWLSQQNSEQDPTVQQSSTNVIFFAPHLFLTKEGLAAWKQFNRGELKSLPTHPDQPFLMQLPLHSLDALLTALYGDYDLNDLPVEDPIMKHIEFRVNLAEFNRLVAHFVTKYQLAPLTEAEINSCKTDVEGQYFVKELAANVIQQKKKSQTACLISPAIAKRILQVEFPTLSDAAIATILCTISTAQGIKRKSLNDFIKRRKKALACDE